VAVAFRTTNSTLALHGGFTSVHSRSLVLVPAADSNCTPTGEHIAQALQVVVLLVAAKVPSGQARQPAGGAASASSVPLGQASEHCKSS
jgi:hypothetical protein